MKSRTETRCAANGRNNAAATIAAAGIADADRQQASRLRAIHVQLPSPSRSPSPGALTARSSPAAPPVAAVRILLSANWSAWPKYAVNEFRHDLEILVSANTTHVHTVLSMLVSTFRVDHSFNQPHESVSISRAAFDNVHSVLSSILRLIPNAVVMLPPLISEFFPHKSESIDTNVWYLKNAIQIASYAPVLESTIWSLAIDRLVQIDAEIQTALDNLDEVEYDSVVEHCFDCNQENLEMSEFQAIQDASNLTTQMFQDSQRDPSIFEPSDYVNVCDRESCPDYQDDSETAFSDDSIEYSDEFSEPLMRIVSDFRRMSGLLDSMLKILMEQVLQMHEASVKDSSIYMDSFFAETLLPAFARSVLPTHKCRYTQFLLFKACALNASCGDAFLGFAAEKTLDAHAPAGLRIAAVGYLGSFIARAKFLDNDSLRSSLILLNSWAVQYVEDNESRSAPPDLVRDRVFYAIVQTVLYVFCFRWKEIMSHNDGCAKLPVELTGLQRVVMSRFSPLQVCTEAVVTEFANLTHKLEVLYCFSIMDGKSRDFRRKLLPEELQKNDLNRFSDFAISGTIDAFFPFDPCNLPMCSKLIADVYNEWHDDEHCDWTSQVDSEDVNWDSTNSVLFTDIFEVTDVNKGGKKFDRVSRINATSEAADTEMILDINTEIYPMKVSDKFTLALASSISLDGGAAAAAAVGGKKETWRDNTNQRSLADDYEYVMFGKVYKYDETGGKTKASVYVSFGGLLLLISGEALDVNIGQEIYLLIRKNT
ncbi:hypothetical protein HDU83_009152 [Entophlyctis luteolus]|nr:hypothetical protein HDU83_009152 [Entophlyctis luteolus]